MGVVDLLKGPHRSPNGIGSVIGFRIRALVTAGTVGRVPGANRGGGSIGVKAATVQTVGAVGVFLGDDAEIAAFTFISVGKRSTTTAAGSAVGLGAKSVLVGLVIGGYNLSSEGIAISKTGVNFITGARKTFNSGTVETID